MTARMLKYGLILLTVSGVLKADPVPQSQVSFTEGSDGTWNVDWDGVDGRTYFVQYSTDLQTWGYAPIIRYGSDVQSCGVFTQNAEKCFIRLKYIDDPAITSLDKARNADFDGDGIPNAIEVENIGADPFDATSVGPDTDNDGMPPR